MSRKSFMGDKRIRAAMKNKHHSEIEDHRKFGASLIGKKQYSEACDFYENTTKKFPNDFFLFYAKGIAHQHNKQPLEAIDSYCQALGIDPTIAEAFENLAEAQTELELFDDALVSIRAAIALKPQKPIGYARLARILIRLGQYNEAINVATHALNLAPQSATTYMIRSDAYRALNLLEHSNSDLLNAIAIDPENSEYLYNLSFNLLLNMNLDEGWSLYESRFQTKKFLANQPKMIAPYWLGTENLKDKTILIVPEQGLGDQIQFSRYAFILKDLGANVIMPVDPSLIQLMELMHQSIYVTSSMQPVSDLPNHDFYIPLMSLPRVLKTDIDHIPSFNRYLSVDSLMSKKWAQRFENPTKLQIGIAWSGNALHMNDHNRSMSLSQLQDLFDLDAEFHVLQTDIRPADEVLLTQVPLKDWRNELTNLHETAGLLEQLDLLITVDTSIAHLAAALGKPTWVMLPFAPDFRWLLNRHDSPWYPSVRLFRQTTPGDWACVVSEVLAMFEQWRNKTCLT